MPTNARRLHKVGTGGPWGSGLLILGLIVTMIGFSFATAEPADLAPALAWIDQAVPVRLWAHLWICVGLYSIWKALTPPQRHIDLAPAVGVFSLWSAMYGMYWLVSGAVEGEWTRGWMAAVVWGAFAAVLICFGRCVNPPRKQPVP